MIFLSTYYLLDLTDYYKNKDCRDLKVIAHKTKT